MKHFKSILLIVLLIGFPLISYLYLKSGYNFRLEALKQLEPKEEIADFSYPMLSSDRLISLSDIKSKVTIIYNADANNSEGMLNPIFDKFSDRKEFQVFGFSLDSTVILQSQNNRWTILNGEYIWDSQLALVDTSATIRSYYTIDSSEFHLLARHIPIIMPREKEKDIVMKSQNSDQDE